jgi:prepilin-type N-terminal cleavage/methylation domain-containing protein/prepilin-type processing-associated H-X9-DG protein
MKRCILFRASRPMSRAFTLVELLVVVALMTVLAALLFPLLARAREGARRIFCLSNLRQLAGAHHLYVQDWDERLPPWRFLPARSQAGSGEPLLWLAFLGSYLGSPGITRDPAAGEPPIAFRPREPLADYVLLTWQSSGDKDLPTDPYVRWPGPPLTRDQVVWPSKTIQWMDGWTALSRTQGETRRHGAGVNVAFVDGHARWMREPAFWRVEWDTSGYYWLYHGCANR